MALILGIETSCDETALSIVEDGRKVLSNSIASQIAKHAVYGGVVPELAAREHLTAIETVAENAFDAAGVSPEQIDAVAVTHAPGLIPALLIGLHFGKGFAASRNVPLIGINHFLAHIYGAFLENENFSFDDRSLFPMLALVVSGGHTGLVIIKEDGKVEMVGYTLDDAAGEAFDKAAKLLNLGYPGGPLIEKLAKEGNSAKFKFPRSLTGAAGKALAEENRFNFSFSGLKTALLYHTKAHAGESALLDGELLYDTLASYQEAIVDVLCMKAFDAAQHFGVKSAILCGGVACNRPLRTRFETMAPPDIRIAVAPPKYCTDNAAMVAGLGYHYFKASLFSPMTLDAQARLPSALRIPF